MEMEDHCCIPASRAKYKPATHVIFDLDGTILDSETVYDAAIEEVAGKHGKKLTPELKCKLYGTRSTDRAVVAVESLGLPITPEEFLEAIKAISIPKLGNCQLMPGAEALIKHFHEHDVPMAIATSSTEESYNIKTKVHKELFDLFEHVVLGGTDPAVTNGKPAPDIFLICASRFSSRPRPRDCLVIEDAPNGVQGALAAGMQVVMVPRDTIPVEVWKTATLRLDSLEYMMPELFELPRLPRDTTEPDLSMQFSDIQEASTAGDP